MKPCSVYLVAAFAIALLAAWQSRVTRKSLTTISFCLVTIAVVAVLFELPISTVLWKTLPELKFVQFPFRFLPLLSFASTLLLFDEGVSQLLRRICVPLLLLLAIAPFFNFRRSPSFPSFPSFDVAVTTWRSGFEAPPEYVPIAVTPAIASRESELRAEGPFPSSACQPTLVKSLANEKVILTNAHDACTLTLNTFYYPFWKATLEGGSLLQVAASSNGLLTVGVPQGPQRVTFLFVPETRTRTSMKFVSFMTFLIVLLWVAAAQYNRTALPAKLALPGRVLKRAS